MRHVLLALALVTTAAVHADDFDQLKVGVQPDGRVVVPTNQILKPAGKQVLFPGRPVDLAWLDDGKTVVVKNMKSLEFIDVATAKVRQTLASPVGFSVVGLVVHRDRIYVSDVQSALRVAIRSDDGSYRWDQPIPLTKPKDGKAAHPSGLALMGDKLWVCSTRGNNVQLVDLRSGKVEAVIDVGVAPYMPRVVGERVFVSNWGGDPPKAGEPQADSSGTKVRVDPKTGVANDGTVSVIEKVNGQWTTSKSIKVGLHPSGMAVDRALLLVANANSDTVSMIDTQRDQVIETISCRPQGRLPFGSGCNAIAVGSNGTYFVANGTNNCIAVVQRGEQESRDRALRGLIPTGWYPGAILLSPDGQKLIVANIKGHGSLAVRREAEKGHNSHDHLGSVSIIDVPNDEQLKQYTQTVNENNRLAFSLAGLEKPRPDAKPVPVPLRHGEPSVIKHVIYVIKENRTYDQVFGDMKEGNGDPKLCIFGEEITPNHHALARQFTLFDNFYCSGVLSADGHQWVTESYVTDYLERSFGGFARSYPFDGDDPLAYASSGFLWDNALARGKTIRNYGEFAKTRYNKPVTWSDVYNDFKTGAGQIQIITRATVKTLEPFTHTGFPAFQMNAPDVLRAKLFIDDLKQFEQQGTMPNLIYITLPCDHTSGTRPGSPTPRAMVADNDLALGQLVEAVTKSKFWKETAIFIVEDDPQAGFDHVDAHRTVALVISPYTKRKFVDHTQYNQTGMVKTIELILGLPPMNQLDLSATAMRHCFQNEPDFTPYTALPNKIALDEMNPPLKDLKGQALHWAKKSLEEDLDEIDRADEDTLNRILWHAMRGDGVPYPETRRPRSEDD